VREPGPLPYSVLRELSSASGGQPRKPRPRLIARSIRSMLGCCAWSSLTRPEAGTALECHVAGHLTPGRYIMPTTTTQDSIAIFIHGFTGSGSTWDEFPALLAHDPQLGNYRARSVCLVSSGNSGWRCWSRRHTPWRLRCSSATWNSACRRGAAVQVGRAGHPAIGRCAIRRRLYCWRCGVP
jgi:hypothetical protein